MEVNITVLVSKLIISWRVKISKILFHQILWSLKRENFNILEIKIQHSFSFYIVYKFRNLINNTDSKNISNVPPVSITISQFTCHVNNGKCETRVEESLEKAISLNGGNSRCIAYDEYRNKGYCAYVQGVTQAQGGDIHTMPTLSANTAPVRWTGAKSPAPKPYSQNNHFVLYFFDKPILYLEKKLQG